ncbi:hypothetical protein EDD85DRAFT_1026698 [Armillaria nabsnona]|nr:hypothetical protein EDD85DRAFT_1026698 [Armillaria nabsnona]
MTTSSPISEPPQDSLFASLSRFHANRPTANSAHSTPRTAGRLLAIKPVGNIADIPSNIPPTSTGIAPPAARLCSTAAKDAFKPPPLRREEYLFCFLESFIITVEIDWTYLPRPHDRVHYQKNLLGLVIWGA